MKLEEKASKEKVLRIIDETLDTFGSELQKLGIPINISVIFESVCKDDPMVVARLKNGKVIFFLEGLRKLRQDDDGFFEDVAKVFLHELAHFKMSDEKEAEALVDSLIEKQSIQ